MTFIRFALSCFLLLTAACTKTVVLHPGAVNAFDSISADTLLTTQTTIEQAKAQVGVNPTAHAILNQLIVSYNAAETAYRVYHSAAATGGNPDPSALQQQIGQLVASVAQLVTALKGDIK